MKSFVLFASTIWLACSVSDYVVPPSEDFPVDEGSSTTFDGDPGHMETDSETETDSDSDGTGVGPGSESAGETAATCGPDCTDSGDSTGRGTDSSSDVGGAPGDDSVVTSTGMGSSS